MNSPATRLRGKVKIISIEGDTVKREIEIMTGTTIAANGNFTAKIKPMTF
jgi:hypothetical protein